MVNQSGSSDVILEKEGISTVAMDTMYLFNLVESNVQSYESNPYEWIKPRNISYVFTMFAPESRLICQKKKKKK